MREDSGMCGSVRRVRRLRVVRDGATDSRRVRPGAECAGECRTVGDRWCRRRAGFPECVIWSLRVPEDSDWCLMVPEGSEL